MRAPATAAGDVCIADSVRVKGGNVKYSVRPWRRTVARLLVLALAVGAAPVNCLASEPAGPQQASPTLAASMHKAVQQEAGKVAKVSPRAARQAGASAPADTSSGGFFKSKAGVATILLLAAGTGFALYSTSHDRVKSPNVPYNGGR
jgi:hypothetical protein